MSNAAVRRNGKTGQTPQRRRRARAPVPPAHGATVAFIVERLREDIWAGRLRAGIAACRIRPDRPLRGQPRAGAGGLEAPQRRRADRASAASRRGGPALDRARDPRTVPDPDRNGGARRPPCGRRRRARAAHALRRLDRADPFRRAAQPLRLSQGKRRLPRRRDGARRQSRAARSGDPAAIAADHGAGRRRADASRARGVGPRTPRHRQGDPRARDPDAASARMREHLERAAAVALKARAARATAESGSDVPPPAPRAQRSSRSR